MKGSEPPRIKVKPQNIKTMEIQVNDYTVQIAVKSNIRGQKTFNKQDTLSFLNWLSFAFYHAARHNEAITCYAIAEDMQKTADEIYNICKEKGLYNEPHNKKR